MRHDTRTVSCLFVGAILAVLTGCGTAPGLPQLEPGLSGQLYVPDGDGPFPGMVLLHGSGGLDHVYHDEAKILAENGMAALVLDYYHEIGKGGGNQAERARRWGVWQDATLRAVRYLSGLPTVDAGRIGLMGFSQGGTLAISVVPRIPKLAVLVDYFGPSIDGWYVTWWLGYESESYLEDLARFPPTIILHGTADPIVPIENSRTFFEGLEGRGRIVEFHRFEGRLHAFNDPSAGLSRSTEDSDEARRLVLGFLNRYLKNGDK